MICGGGGGAAEYLRDIEFSNGFSCHGDVLRPWFRRKSFLKKLSIPLDPASRRITKGGEGELLIRMTHFNIVFSLSSKPCGNDS